MTIKLAKQLY